MHGDAVEFGVDGGEQRHDFNAELPAEQVESPAQSLPLLQETRIFSFAISFRRCWR